MKIQSVYPPKIVYVTPNAPLPANRGGRIRAHHIWRALNSIGRTNAVVLGDKSSPALRGAMRQSGAKFFPRRRYNLDLLHTGLRDGNAVTLPSLFEIDGRRPYPPHIMARLTEDGALNRHHLNRGRAERLARYIREGDPDVVVLCDTSLGVLAPYLNGYGCKIIVGPHNYDSLLYSEMSRLAPTVELRNFYTAAAKAFSAAEEKFFPYVDQLWVCSAADADRFSLHCDRSKIVIVPNVIDVIEPIPFSQSSRNLLYVGQLEYFPNTVAALHLIEISKRLDERNVAHRMQIVGRSVPLINRAAESAKNVELTGEVPDVSSYLADARIIPIPLTIGGGTRLKILEGMAAGRPIISTPVGIEGIEARDKIHALIEPDLTKFPSLIERLLGDSEEAERLAGAAFNLAAEKYSHLNLRHSIGDALDALGFTARGDHASSHNTSLSPTLRNSRVSFNPQTRVLLWSFNLRVAATRDALVGEVHGRDNLPFPNAFVLMGQEQRGWIKCDVEAVIPNAWTPDEIRIALFAWGFFGAEVRPPKSIPDETAWFLAIEDSAEFWQLQVLVEDPTTLLVSNAVSRTLDGEEKEQSNSSGLRNLKISKQEPLQQVALLPNSGVGPHFGEVSQWLRSERPTSAQVLALKDVHAGKTAWLIGNGPSVSVQDLDRLEGKLAFAFNRFHLAHDKTSFRPQYTVTADRQMIEDFGQDIVDKSGGTVFVADETLPDLVGNFIWLRLRGLYPPLFSLNPAKVVSPGGSSLFVAMQIAFFMGVRRFYVYGADFNFNFARVRRPGDSFRIAQGDGNHFIPNYRGGKAWCPPSIKHIGASFFIARKLLEGYGGFIKNVTRGGRLDMFDRLSFDEAIEAI